MKMALPADVLEAFGSDPNQTLKLTTADLKSSTSTSTKSPPPGARALLLLRRLELVRGPWGTGEGDALIALFDASRFPAAWATPVKTRDRVLAHYRSLLHGLLERLGIRVRSYKAMGFFHELSLAAPMAKKVRPLVEAQKAWIGSEPAYSKAPEPAWADIAKVSLQKYDELAKTKTGPAAAKKKAPTTKVPAKRSKAAASTSKTAPTRRKKSLA